MEEVYYVAKMELPGELKLIKVSERILGLRFLQQQVDGYIEVVALGEGILLVCNEEGKFNSEYRPTFPIVGDTVVGPIVFCKEDGADMIAFTKEEIKALPDFLNNSIAQLLKGRKSK